MDSVSILRPWERDDPQQDHQDNGDGGHLSDGAGLP